MKRLLLILLVLGIAAPCAAQQVIVAKKKVATSCAGSSTYFGQTTTTGNWDTGANYTFGNDGTNLKYRPASSGTVCDLAVYAKSGGGTPANTRVAIYKASDRSLVCQCSSEILVSSTSASWVGCSYPNISGTCTVDSGTDYILASSNDGSDVNMLYISGASNTNGYKGSYDNTGGFPSTLAAWSGTLGINYAIRAGVQ